MRPRLVLVGPAVFALILGACGTGLPRLPGQVAANGNAEARSAGPATADMMLRRNVRYELAKGVTVDAKTAKAYQLGDGSSGATAKLAKAFGVKGSVRSEPDGGWSVGENNKEGVVTSTSGAMHVTKDGGAFSMYWSYPFTASGCAVAPAQPTTGPDESVSSNDPGTKPTCEAAAPSTWETTDISQSSTTTTGVPGAAPTKAEAQRIATDALDAGGVNLHDPKVTVESFDGSAFNVRFQPTIDGIAVDGYEASVTVDATKKITGANGFVGQLDSLGSYDLATLQRAVDRLNESMTQPYAVDGRESYTDMGAPGAASSGVAEPAKPTSVTQVAPAGGAGTSEPGTSEPAPDGGPYPPVDATPTVITLTKASVGSMLQGDSEGALFLVPAYLFTSDSDEHVVAAAADDKYIEQPSTDTTDVAKGGGSGGGGGSASGSSGQCAAVTVDEVNGGGITAQVCASSTTVKAGENITFTIAASDPDRAFTDGPCGDGVTEEFGDNAGGTARCMACAASVGDGPGKIERKREHAYAKAGTYTAKFTVTSGTMCEKAPKDSTATLSLKLTVV